MRQEWAGDRGAVVDALGRVATCIAAGAKRDLIVRLVARSTRQLLNADYAALFLDTEDGWVVCAADGLGSSAGRPFGPMLLAPVRVDGYPGWMCVCRAVGRSPFMAEEADLVARFADHATDVLEQDELRRRNADLERVSDQWRAATELQTLAGEQIFHASVRLSGAVAEIGDARTRDRVVDAIDNLDHAIKIIRQIAFGLIEQAKAPRRALRR